MDGFTFSGTHSSTYGCWYIPDAKDRGGDMEDYEINELLPDNRDGGYYAGVRAKPRDFELDCYFEEITEAQQEGIYRWLRRGTSGELVFDAKPYVCYSVTPSKKIAISLYDHETENGTIRYSGTFTAFFRCYDPFGELRKISWNDSALPGEQTHTGLLPVGMMPAPPTAQTRKLLVYNPGTERAHTRIRLAGSVGSGLLIRNFTTGQRCRVVSLKEDSLLPGAVQELDSRMGQTRIVLGEETTLAFAMHDEGYIELAPCTPFVRALKITHTAGSNEIISEAGFKKYMEGQYLYLDGWKEIRQVAGTDQATLSEPANRSGETDTPIVTMNELEFSGEDVVLTRLEVEYVPRIR